MSGEIVLDASVAAKCFFPEAGSDLANAVVLSGVRIVAPELIHAEVANVAARRAQRGETDPSVARRAIEALDELIDETCPLAPLRTRAFDLALASGLSAYDAIYVALAEARGAQLVTADARLVQSARAAGLGAYVVLLGASAP